MPKRDAKLELLKVIILNEVQRVRELEPDRAELTRVARNNRLNALGFVIHQIERIQEEIQ